MAVPVIASSSSNTSVTTSVVITKPTGVAVGDALVAYVVGVAGSSGAITPPAGWTSRQLDGTGTRRFGMYTKIADSGDVSASNYTWSMVAATGMVGHISRITGVASGSEFTTSEIDVAGPTASPSYTGASTPLTTDTLVMMCISTYDTNGLPTVSGYTTTPSMTWTELYDNAVDAGSSDPSIAVAYATSGTTSQITAYSATLSQSKTTVIGTLLLIQPFANASGTNALLAVSPSFFSENGRASTVGSNALLQASPTFFSESGTATSPTVWTNEADASTTWVNETL